MEQHGRGCRASPHTQAAECIGNLSYLVHMCHPSLGVPSLVPTAQNNSHLHALCFSVQLHPYLRRTFFPSHCPPSLSHTRCCTPTPPGWWLRLAPPAVCASSMRARRAWCGSTSWETPQVGGGSRMSATGVESVAGQTLWQAWA